MNEEHEPLALFRVESYDELYYRADNDPQPRDAYVTINPLCRTLWASAFHWPTLDGQREEQLRWPIPILRAEAANTLLEQLAPYAERVCEGYSREWNAKHCSWVHHYTNDARVALALIDERCKAVDEKDALVVRSAEDYLREQISGDRDAQRAALKLSAASKMGDVIARVQSLTTLARAEHGIDILDGLHAYLLGLRDEVLSDLTAEVVRLSAYAQPGWSTDLYVRDLLEQGVTRAEDIAKAYDTMPVYKNKNKNKTEEKE